MQYNENIKKLLRTGKFDSKQEEQIRTGLQKGLDVSIYAKLEFSAEQMCQIKQGLEEYLDVSVYAKPEFDWSQMGEIRIGLKKELDVTIYAKPEFDREQMREIRLGLEKSTAKSKDSDLSSMNLFKENKSLNDNASEFGLSWTDRDRLREKLERETQENLDNEEEIEL